MNNENTPHFTSLEGALKSLFGTSVSMAGNRRVSGGDINNSYEIILSDGTHFFMKANAGKGEDFFEAELDGLSAIAQTNTVRTPHVLGIGTESGQKKYSFLLMEFIERKAPVSGYWDIFASQLAAMHKADAAAFVGERKYGFWQDNFIGERPQLNRAADDWISFFRECRLEAQFKKAEAYFQASDLKSVHKLLERLDDLLLEPSQPSLLHGDMWSGNVITGDDGKAWLIDPAAYVGNAEADIAMTELFGGFPASFYDAYKRENPLEDGYDDRRDIYNLYQLLNHLNMFGASYLMSVKRIIHKYV